MPNRLAQENSPYLRQHAENPVDWYPWGEEALQRAQAENKPILLSIGYAACHWCHVMAHESFEDPATAQIMNAHFINIKVDREERPDLDSIYMNAVVALTGHGGWPMTVFLTPEGRPFYGGTYFPPVPRYNMPGFSQLLAGIDQAWQTQREKVLTSAEEITTHLGRVLPLEGQGELNRDLLSHALKQLFRRFDQKWGGFGEAPKFPPSMVLEFLLAMRQQTGDGVAGDNMALLMAEQTLKRMAYGGIYDQIGGGFARYSTDVYWLVPHFEKMLYDNALLARVYLHAWQVTGQPLYRRIVEETLDFVLRELRHGDGGFYSSYDADSEGEEGKFYVWTAVEIRQVLGAEAEPFLRFYGVTDKGNWEGHTILQVPQEPAEVAKSLNMAEDTLMAKLAEAKKKLYAVRAKRVWPGLDDKVVTAWNGLMLAAFAEAGRALQRPDYTAAAIQNAAFLQKTLWHNGRLLRVWKDGGTAKYNAYLEDYAYLADGLLALYQTTFEPGWLAWAHELAEVMLTHFSDTDNGGFYDTSDDHESLIQRPKDVQDNATPSGNAMAAQVLLRLSLYTGNGRYWDTAQSMTAALRGAMMEYPTGFAHWLGAAALLLSEPQEVALVGQRTDPDLQALWKVVAESYRPHLVVALGDGMNDGGVALLQERPLHDGRATAYVCRRFVCQASTHDPQTLATQLKQQ